MTYQLTPAKATAKFTEVSLSSNTAFSSGATVTLNSITHSHPSTSRVSLSSNVVTLTAGNYIIYGSVAIDKNTTDDTYTMSFYDNATSTELTIADGWMGASTCDVNNSGSLLMQAHLELSSSVSFYVVSTGATGTLRADGVYFIIMEL